MPWTLMLAALIVAVVVAVTAIGWRIPAERRTTREADLINSAQVVWDTGSDLPALPP